MNYLGLWAAIFVPAFLLSALSWPNIVRTVRARGLAFPAWGGHSQVLAHFHRIAAEERDPAQRTQFRRWLVMMYLAFALVAVWFVAVLVAAI